MTSRQLTPRHLALAVGLAAVWGVNFVVMQVGLRHFPPLLYAGLRFALAGFPALLLVGRPQVAWRWVAGVAAAIGVGQFGLLLMGMRAGMPAGLTSLVLQAQVVFTVVFAVLLLGERLTARRVGGLSVAFAGLALVAFDFGLSGPVGAFALCVAAAAAWGLGNVLQRRAAPPDSLRFMVWVSALSAPPLILLSLLVEGAPRLAVPAEGWLSLAYVAFVSTLGGFGVWGWLLRRYDASTVAPYTLLVPVFGLSSAALLTGEPLSWVKVAAGALIVAGVLYAGGRPRARSRSRVAEPARATSAAPRP
ncbi:EamA family transporter [Nonomuraea roseoviolacea]|uniref:O-acetylserine/cysteine efflux transporter n=1 Tax=Nonomuraea roseoviolacea subsp. carminata TaxID=160689 RepID=A0ABT1JZN5_9ACTN|nr:EamA family transporter [Nonomuraea roseoviolacea]MCP2346807.1 O-acetylserine/cysteine efflux transporter [Nonomuraea roseoviolacea subsp. carminata]